MIQYMLDTGLMPGTGQDVSMIAAKLGIQGAFQDIQNNHPNDLVSLIMFSRPSYTGEPTCVGQFTQPQVTLDQQLQQPDQCPVVPAQQRHRRRHALGPQRIANAAGPRRLRLKYRHELRSDAGVQPVQQQHGSSERPTSAAGAERAPTSC